MNWYKIAKKEEKEYPIAAAIIAAGQIFEGRSHLDALLKAMKAKYVYRDKEGELRDKNGAYLEYTGTGNLDLFITNKGNIITRIESFKMGHGMYSEDIPENKRKDFKNELV